MSDVTPPAGTSVPANPPAPVAAPAPVVAAPPPVPSPATAPISAVDPNAEPPWLPDRLNRAKEIAKGELLKELGVDDPEAAKAAISAAKAAADAKKSAEEKAAELATKLSTTQTEAQRLAALAKEHAGRMLLALTPEQQKAITDFAGENAEQQLRAIHHFAPLWAKQEADAAAAKAAAASAAQPPEPPPANTSPAPTAPSGVTPTSPPDARSAYLAERARNPFAAAAYGLSNPQAYEIKS